ncbi:hypothetical protein FACS1894214_4550 [Planctomycetales bacterium]|nr:hypothetical protein FACS1894214_4550 [Planctomycetales bacterium]
MAAGERSGDIEASACSVDGSGGGLEFAAKRECGGGGVQAGVSPIERKVAEAAETAIGGNVAVRFVCVIENM